MRHSDPNGLAALRADAYRLHGRDSLALLLKSALARRTFRPIATLRLCRWAAARGPARALLPVFKALHLWARHHAGMDLPWNLEAGPGLAIDHGWGLVVNAKARLGRNVTLYHGVTLGQRDRVGSDGGRVTEYPVIEDEVWIGPHAVIVGGVRVGRGSRIAAGAFVTENVPPHSVVGGNPARVLKSGCVPDVLNPAPLSPGRPSSAADPVAVSARHTLAREEQP
jgi:serine O-acetyltransferase